ncbi:hypothetical protein FN846DRAFT_954519 [Sphaerosporella brunnea]|uniref:Inhibitor of growth protein N-terminal histone-binding domain-containing protein n=1 Tax=Sphaerosporella brunnea TaxID=1250544 RepID=A0A5J5ET50_9PEZI|nr:hypothetical protein FN846DRAFT_954519 [Sphaerosporella brunnea]
MATKPPIPASSSSTIVVQATARRQPIRQARTVRKPVPKTANGTETSAQHHAPAKFYPALKAFTDAVDALPSEIIRHFTLLREVDAKACLPEANLRNLIDAAERLPASDDPYAYDAAMEALKKLVGLRQRRDADPMFASNATPAALLAELEKLEAADAAPPEGNTVLGNPESRRARYHQIRAQISDLLVTQEEKIHVITTAVEALQKHLSRVEHAFAYVEVEIPAIYRQGNPEHWGYKEPMRRGTAAQIAREKERERREQEERAHQAQMERESNVRGTARGNAGKNSHSNHYSHQDDEVVKKKARKTGDNETLSSAKRIADQQAGAQNNSTKKRKAAPKDDKKESTNTKGTASPRAGTPVPKKAKNTAQRAPRR